MGIPCTKRSGCSDHALWRVRFHWWNLVRLWHLVGPPGTTSPFPLLTPQEAGSSISGMATLTALKQLPTVMRPSNRFPSSASSATASAGDGAAMIAQPGHRADDRRAQGKSQLHAGCSLPDAGLLHLYSVVDRDHTRRIHGREIRDEVLTDGVGVHEHGVHPTLERPAIRPVAPREVGRGPDPRHDPGLPSWTRRRRCPCWSSTGPISQVARFHLLARHDPPHEYILE